MVGGALGWLAGIGALAIPGIGPLLAAGPIVAALAGAGAGGAVAQQKFTVAAYGGSDEDMMRKGILPAWEKKANVKAEYVAGNSTDNIARLQAQRANQEIDVAILDDGPMYQAVALGLCDNLKSVSFADLYPVADMKTGKSVTIGVVGVLLATFLGWILAKSMQETRGLFWAWFIHFWQDVWIFSFMAVGSIVPGG